MMKRRTWIQLFFVLFLSCVPNCYGETLEVMDERVAAAPTGLVVHGLMQSEDGDTLTLGLPSNSSNVRRVEFADRITIRNILVPEPTGFFFATLAVFTLLGGRHLMIARPRK